MNSKFKRRFSFFILLSGFLMIIISSCSNLFNAQVEKRKYRDGFYVNTNKKVGEIKSNQNLKINSKTNKIPENNYNPEPVYIADNSDTMSICMVNEKPILFSSNTVKTERESNNEEKNSENRIRKKDVIKAIKHQVKISKASGNDTPCPNPRKGFIIWGSILVLIGLLLLISPSAGVMILGLIIGLIGLILYFVGKSKPDPYITKTEPIELVDDMRTPLKVPQFDYKAVSSSNEKVVSLSLLTPQYAQDFKYKGESPFTEFAKSMEKDFEEILYERQYTFIGPFRDYDEMVFSDKSKTDLLLEVEINISWKDNLQTKPVEVTEYANQTWSCGTVRKVKSGIITKYSFDGTAGIGAEISIKASEIMTKQKVWVKKISIDPQYINVKSEKLYNERTIPATIWTKDPGFYNPMTDFLEKYYKEIMQKAWNHLDPNELKQLKPQIEKIREESGFNRK